MKHSWQCLVLVIALIAVSAAIDASAQADVFKAGPSYGLTLSQTADWGSDMYRLTGTIKYGPIRLFPVEKRFVYAETLDSPTVVKNRGYVHPDSIEALAKKVAQQERALPNVTDTVHARHLISITTVAGYSYIYDAPAEGGLFVNTFDQSGVYGGMIFNINQELIADILFGDDTESSWINPRPLEVRPYVGLGFTFLPAATVNAKLDLSKFNGASDTLTGNVVLAMPAALAIDLMCGIGFTIEKKISIIVGLNFTNLLYEGVIPTVVENELKGAVNERLSDGLRMSFVGFQRTNGMIGMSINL